VGTVRISRRNMPNELKNNVDRGHTNARYSGNLMALKWKDKKDIVMLSTYHDDRTTTVSTYRGEKEKLEVVVEYNRHMGAVDVADQMMAAYPVERKRKKSLVQETVRTFTEPRFGKSTTTHRTALPKDSGTERRQSQPDKEM